MIYYLVAERHINEMRYFLQYWGTRLAPRVRIVTYEALLAGRDLPPEHGGTYIFTNLGAVNAMKPRERSTIFELHDRLVEANGARKVLNDPARSLRRYNLLRCLHERGVNAFNAYHTDDPRAPVRFPAFIRHESHSDYQPVIAKDASQYEALRRGIKWQAGSLAELISVEFCDVADGSGLFRKYGAFVIGERIVPCHVFFSRNWYNRHGDITDAAGLEEELRFLGGNPHADTLLECSRLAGISYGRIDYGLLEGRPQVWEINTNPSVATERQVTLPERRQGLLQMAAAYTEAMEAIDSVA